MKVVIVSDIHSNFAALKALPEQSYDQLWCLGDLVDYGPAPREVIQWIGEHSAITVRGNHDHAVGFDVDPQCSQPFKRLAAETMKFTQQLCTEKDLAYLRNLAVRREITLNGTRCFLVHAIPTNPFFGYCPENSEQWRDEVQWIEADLLVVGHTHTPFVRKVGRTTILNPGSLGQPKTGRPLACYAVWQDGEISLKEYDYPLAETVRGIRAMPIPQESQDALIRVLETGSLPASEVAR